jgi:hypothetical protein
MSCKPGTHGIGVVCCCDDRRSSHGIRCSYRFRNVEVTFVRFQQLTDMVTGRLYRPKYATEQTLPAVLLFMVNNDKDTQAPTAIELARGCSPRRHGWAW